MLKKYVWLTCKIAPRCRGRKNISKKKRRRLKLVYALAFNDKPMNKNTITDRRLIINIRLNDTVSSSVLR